MALTTYLPLAPTLGMSRAIPLLHPCLPSLHFTERLYVRGKGHFCTWEFGDTAGPGSFASNVGLSELVLLVTYAHLRNTKLSVCTGIHMKCVTVAVNGNINPLKPELNPICYLLALLGAHHFLHVSRIRVKLLTLR